MHVIASECGQSTRHAYQLLRADEAWSKEQLALVREVEDAMDALTMSNLVGGKPSPPPGHRPGLTRGS